jgi:hypothetical protein
MDSLITALVLLVVSAIATWMKKKAATGQDDSTQDAPQAPPPMNRPRPASPTSWEEELRRLLEGQSTTAPPSARPPPMQAPPPMVVTPRPRPVSPTPPIVVRPVLVSPERRAVISTPRPAPAPMPVPSRIEISAAQLAPLRQSGEAYQRANQPDKQVAEQISPVPGRQVLATSISRRTVSPEITQVVSLFKSARSARQAVIASLILGPPRSIEEISQGYSG